MAEKTDEQSYLSAYEDDSEMNTDSNTTENINFGNESEESAVAEEDMSNEEQAEQALSLIHI